MKVLKTPWKNEFLELVANSKRKIRITSPFIKENICNELLEAKINDSKISLITSFKIFNLYSGSLDINGLENLINNKVIVKNKSQLHSKIYIFDDKKAIVSSANLTNGGLISNYEYGILLEDKSIVHKVIDDYNLLFYDDDTGRITLNDIKTVKKILDKIPKVSKITIPKYALGEMENEGEILTTESQTITDNLKGWKRDIFIIINSFKKQTFSLNDLYNYENELHKVHPQNNNIKDKIRQQLQILRDLSLIEFLGNGKYRKLWKER